VHASPQAVDYFASLGHPCPANFNPADFFIEELAVLPSDYEKYAPYPPERLAVRDASVRGTLFVEMSDLYLHISTGS
jgi:hypothetical protein